MTTETETRVDARTSSQTFERVESPRPARPRRPIRQVTIAAIVILVAVGGVFLVQRVRANELVTAAPRITSISPPDGATGVATVGEFRITFATLPENTPTLSFAPPLDREEATHWDGTTLVVSYNGLRAQTLYLASLSDDYRSVFGERGQFEKQWSFVTEVGPPPPGSPLIWYSLAAPDSQGSKTPGTQIALDWSGTDVGILHEPGMQRQSPDGSRLMVPGIGTVDQSGQVIAATEAGKAGPVWADDSRHLCQLLDASGGDPGALEGAPTWIFIGPVAGPLHRVAQAGHVGGQSGPEIAACSVSNDRVVVVENVIAYTTDVWVYRLSTGGLLYHHAYGAGQVASSVVASHDGRFLAEQILSADAQGHQVFSDTLIRRTSDGKVVGRIAGQSVYAFSWDGSQVITATAFGSTSKNEARLVDWQRGQTLWRSNAPAGTPPGLGYVYALAQPGGSEFAVGTAGANGVPPVQQLWLVRSDGTAKLIAGGTIYPGF